LLSTTRSTLFPYTTLFRSYKAETKTECCEEVNASPAGRIVRFHRALKLLNETRHVLVSISEIVDRSVADRTSDRAGVAQERAAHAKPVRLQMVSTTAFAMRR